MVERVDEWVGTSDREGRVRRMSDVRIVKFRWAYGHRPWRLQVLGGHDAATGVIDAGTGYRTRRGRDRTVRLLEAALPGATVEAS